MISKKMRKASRYYNEVVRGTERHMDKTADLTQKDKFINSPRHAPRGGRR